MTKAIAVTQQGNDTVFMIGDYQAILGPSTCGKGWFVQYFKKSKPILTSNSKNHPVMPTDRLSSKVRAEELVKVVLGCLHVGTPVTKSVNPPVPQTPKRPARPRSKRKEPKVVTAFQVIDRLLNLVDDDCTVLSPMGKPAALHNTKARIVDSEGETICEIPYPIFKKLL